MPKKDARTKRKRRSRTPLVLMIAAAIVASGSAGGWYYLQERSTRAAEQLAAEQISMIANQTVDPVPLTAAEVFGPDAPSTTSGAGTYKILKTQVAACETAVAGDLVAAVAAAGCTQIVRATLLSPDGVHAITAGIFNLADTQKAKDATAAIGTAINAGSGRFGGMVAGGPTNTISRAAANVSWDVRGHYLLYCLVTNADGSAIAASDPRTQSIIDDVVNGHLSVVVKQRQTRNASATEEAPSASQGSPSK